MYRKRQMKDSAFMSCVNGEPCDCPDGCELVWLCNRGGGPVRAPNPDGSCDCSIDRARCPKIVGGKDCTGWGIGAESAFTYDGVRKSPENVPEDDEDEEYDEEDEEW